eukprot:TRINITY_DN1020_c0_g1_i2.p1 TRINITY_DN1020_c0_g1~~TRINITY_DN1020_c0_g1_i2.p1  ORF type:complete len:489 (-),score=103.86 TRINITY_DN1020_c0_g1_i2:357-1823(-)
MAMMGLNCECRVIPGGASLMLPILQHHFPHKTHPMPVQKTFVQNVLTIADYCPVLRQNLIEMTIDKIIQIDVEIKLEEIPDEEELFGENQDHNEGELFGMDMDMDNPDAPTMNQNRFNQTEHTENASKLDSLIDLLINYCSTKIESEQDELFRILLNVFDSIILTTHKSKFTQFIIFFMCQQKKIYVEKFLEYLLGKLNEIYNQQSIRTSGNSSVRQSAAAYIGSFSARAKFINANTTKRVVAQLIIWLQKYIEQFGNDQPDAEKHALFYSVAQSLLYIFCFKHKDLYDQPNCPQNLSFITSLGLNRIVATTLNPLKILLPTVVREFASICKTLCILDCTPIVESNRSVVLSTKSTFGGDNQLDSFFPFDPFLLKLSSQHFKNTYQFWKSHLDEEMSDELSSSHNDRPSSMEIPYVVGLRNKMEYASSLDDNTPFSYEDLNSWEGRHAAGGGDGLGGLINNDDDGSIITSFEDDSMFPGFVTSHFSSN